MKSGPVLTEKRYKWFEPDAWRFGDAQVATLLAQPCICVVLSEQGHLGAVWQAISSTQQL